MKGIPASPGIAIAKAFVKKGKKIAIENKKIRSIETEIGRFVASLSKAKEELSELKEKAINCMGAEEALIFDAHIMLLEDPELKKAVEDTIKNEKVSAEVAVEKVFDYYAQVFSSMEDEYMKARESDIRDIGERIIGILSGTKNEISLPFESILVAEDLAPSDTAQLDVKMVKGFAIQRGSKTSHSVIMARALGIPAVVGLAHILEKVNTGDMLIIDGNSGDIIVNPDEKTLNKYKEKLELLEKGKIRLERYKGEKARTSDGKEIAVAGNIGTLADLNNVLENGGDGVGLFRTEFLYMDRKHLPSEEEQFEVYSEVARRCGEKPVIIRTLDIGGDKKIPYLDIEDEMNPFLGCRAIRICLERNDIFKPQLRAILRAGKYGNLKIMFPMISTLEELQDAKRVLLEVKRDLRNENVDFAEDIEVGIMIETPAAVMIADILAEEVDFFSIGTNDLIQYILAVDRTNEKISKLYNPYHPSILRAIHQVIIVGHKAGIKVGMCGEAAGDELLIPFLIGSDLDEFSMSAISILKSKEVISKWSIAEAKEVVNNVLKMKSSAEIKEYLLSVKK